MNTSVIKGNNDLSRSYHNQSKIFKYKFESSKQLRKAAIRSFNFEFTFQISIGSMKTEVKEGEREIVCLLFT